MLAGLAALIHEQERPMYQGMRSTGKDRHPSKSGKKTDHSRAKVKAARKQRRRKKP
jgi:hypothetical protein